MNSELETLSLLLLSSFLLPLPHVFYYAHFPSQPASCNRHLLQAADSDQVRAHVAPGLFALPGPWRPPTRRVTVVISAAKNMGLWRCMMLLGAQVGPVSPRRAVCAKWAPLQWLHSSEKADSDMWCWCQPEVPISNCFIWWLAPASCSACLTQIHVKI